MECVWRRRMPALVRSLLLDEGVSCASEPEQMSGVLLPVTAAEERRPEPAARPCGLCLREAARYTCPRCNAPYCSLACYRGPAHAACSELFYKDCVTEELRRCGAADQGDRARMRDVLLSMRRAEEGVGRVAAELTETSGGRVTEKDTAGLTLLSRLAEIQADGGEDEVRGIPHTLEQADGEEEDEDDVVTRLAGLNVESLDEDELWKLLPPKDRRRFERLLSDGRIGALVPIWRPWWEEHRPSGAALIEELRQKDTSGSEEREPPSEPTGGNAAPPAVREVPPLSSLCSTRPSPLVKFCVVNVLYVYAFALRLFNGDVSETRQLLEFCRLVLSACESLGRGRSFGSFTEALGGAAASVAAELRDSPSNATEDVARILSGAGGAGAGYVLAALTQLRSALAGARRAAPRGHARFRRTCFSAEKKCEFLQAWANENTRALGGLARQAWSECERQTADRQTLERDRKQTERDRKRNGAAGRELIEEV